MRPASSLTEKIKKPHLNVTHGLLKSVFSNPAVLMLRIWHKRPFRKPAHRRFTSFQVLYRLDPPSVI